MLKKILTLRRVHLADFQRGHGSVLCGFQSPAFGCGLSSLGFLRGATRRRIPEPPCRGKRDLRPGLRAAGFRPLYRSSRLRIASSQLC